MQIFWGQLCRVPDNLRVTRFVIHMASEDEIRQLCARLIECDDDAEIRVLADQLRRQMHRRIEEARSQISVLPLLDSPLGTHKAS